MIKMALTEKAIESGNLDALDDMFRDCEDDGQEAVQLLVDSEWKEGKE